MSGNKHVKPAYTCVCLQEIVKNKTKFYEKKINIFFINEMHSAPKKCIFWRKKKKRNHDKEFISNCLCVCEFVVCIYV